MNYTVEVIDTWGRRIATFDEVPLLESRRATPDERSWIRGVLPGRIEDLGHAYAIRVLSDGALFCEAKVNTVLPQWSDLRKLILDRYVHFHEVVEFEAELESRAGNTRVSRAYTNRRIHAIVKDAINATPGAVHYLVDHTAYPEGAQREHTKFLTRKTSTNELAIGGIDSGDWIASDRMDLTEAYAKDGDTIAGIKVDGVDWPDLRLMMIDCEETSKNSHAISRHPEISAWTSDEYNASAYKQRADAATDFLQSLLDAKGIDHIELNPHRNSAGTYDDRVDAYGRYIGLVYGDGECYNAALVEQAHADVYLYQDGKYHVPEMELKDFFSYAGGTANSIEETSVSLGQFDVTAGVFEVLTAMAYAAGGYVWSLDPNQAVRFRKADAADRVVFYDPKEHAVGLGSAARDLVNTLYFDGSPLAGDLSKTYYRSESITEYGFAGRHLDYFYFSREADADALVEPLLDDVAYPASAGHLTWLNGNADVAVGDLIEVRGAPLRRLERELPQEWGGRFQDRFIGRVGAVVHRFYGRHVETTAELMPPLRSVRDPLSFIIRSQPGASELFQFRLDDNTVGADIGYHLD